MMLTKYMTHTIVLIFFFSGAVVFALGICPVSHGLVSQSHFSRREYKEPWQIRHIAVLLKGNSFCPQMANRSFHWDVRASRVLFGTAFKNRGPKSARFPQSF